MVGSGDCEIVKVGRESFFVALRVLTNNLGMVLPNLTSNAEGRCRSVVRLNRHFPELSAPWTKIHCISGKIGALTPSQCLLVIVSKNNRQNLRKEKKAMEASVR